MQLEPYEIYCKAIQPDQPKIMIFTKFIRMKYFSVDDLSINAFQFT